MTSVSNSMRETGLRVRSLGAALGAEVQTADLLGEMSEDVIAGIQAAPLAYQVLVFPDQTLSPGQQKRFARRFGDLFIHPEIPGLEDHPEIMVLERDASHRGGVFGGDWYSDVSYMQAPSLGSVLYAVEAPRPA